MPEYFNIMHRIFIALKLSPEPSFISKINGFKRDLVTENIKWVDLINIHLTLVFLGDTENSLIKEIDKMLLKKCTGLNQFTFHIRGLSVFKSINDPRVLWAGLNEIEELNILHSVIISGLKEIGMNPEERKFSPHITLGRIKSLKNRDALKKLIENYSDHEFQEVQVKEVILYESILNKTGPVYKPLVIISLH
jgi:RNA 2',3'-cyclic 3'-phosphodiesterase